MIYYIADIHFDDEKIFKKCARPFRDLAEYKEEIYTRWNKKVNPTDTVYVLGDIARDDCTNAAELFRNLNGHKHLLVGNHDTEIVKTLKNSDVFESIDFIKLIDDGGRKVCICHYPLMDWMEFNRAGVHVYGHIHNKTSVHGHAYAQIKEYFKDKPAYNAGVDVTNYEPVTLNEMIELKEKNKNQPYIN